MKLIPVGLVAIWSWWFFGQSARRLITMPQVTGTTATASQPVSTAEITTQATSTSEVTPQAVSTTSTAAQVSSSASVFDFPVTWNGDQATTIDPNNYRLMIDGDVPKPLEFKLEDLYAMTGVQKTQSIQCVEGWSADVPWEGIPLIYLLRLAGMSVTNNTYVTVAGITGYSTALTSVEVANLDFMIALKAGGAPLTVDHGFPARLVAPTRPGEDWVKYVVKITAASY